MDAKYDTHIMVQVAQMYYTEGMTQSNIANQMGISRSSIAMILSDARNYGIVDIKINNPNINNDKLSEAMIGEFNLSSGYNRFLKTPR